ncbi:response regulator transcription factor [Candidatus Daviesbacteria bacterium]|nr:response regulator transcription factor [Candidatus Daviesbacteria bacterium]
MDQPNPSANKKILIIEDDQFLRDFYQELLTSEGYMVDVAGDGETGLTKIKQGGWSLVMLDIMLPKMDGLQVLKEVKALQISNNGPIVVLTNLGNDATVNQCFAMGAAGYLIKSAMNPDEILAEIHNYLAKS